MARKRLDNLWYLNKEVLKQNLSSMTQRKIERYHRSMKNLTLLDNYHCPSELEAQIPEWIDYHNN